MQKIYFLDNMEYVKSLAKDPKDNIYSNLKDLLSKKPVTKKDKIDWLVETKKHIIDLANLLRQLSNYFDFRSTCIQFAASIAILITFAIKIIISEEIFQDQRVHNYKSLIELLMDRLQNNFYSIKIWFTVILFLLGTILVGSILSVSFVLISLVLFALHSLVITMLDFKDYLYITINEYKSVGDPGMSVYKYLFACVSAQWPVIGKGAILILAFLPASSNQMTETLPVQYFYELFFASTLGVEICKFMFEAKNSGIRFKIDTIFEFAAITVIIIYTAFSDPIIYTDFIKEISPKT